MLGSNRRLRLAMETKNHILQLNDGYRSTRRTISVICAVALAWSAAQFDLKTISLGFAGSVDLSHASIPLILICAIAYASARCVLEFAMQSVEVRRWRFAQVDFKLSVLLVRATILILAASGLNRSVDTVLYVALAAVIVLVGWEVTVFIGTMVLTPLLIYVCSRQQGYKSTSIASRIFEAMEWSDLIALFVFVVLFVVLGIASLHYEPLRLLWSMPLTPLAIGVFVFACVATVVSMYFQSAWYRKLFASPPTYTAGQRSHDGIIPITFHELPADVWDWYSLPISNERSRKEPPAYESPPNKANKALEPTT